MRFNEQRSNLPQPGKLGPWHPETIEDIRHLNVFNLPSMNQPVGGEWKLLANFAGYPSFILERMEYYFTHNPAVGFLLGEDERTVYVYQRNPGTVKENNTWRPGRNQYGQPVKENRI